MKPDELAAAAARLRRGELPPGAELVKQSPVRVAARVGDAFIKVFLRPTRAPQRCTMALVPSERQGPKARCCR